MIKLVLIFFSLFYISDQDNTGKVIVEVTNLETREGKILLSVYDSEDGFPGDEEKAIKKMMVEIGEGDCIVELVLPPGIYALSLAHDINNDNEVETNFLGIPKEPLGMSNYSQMGRPKFDKAKFELKAGQVLNMEIPMNTIF